MRSRTEALPLSPNPSWEDLANVDPYNCALRNCEEGNVGHEGPDQPCLVLMHREDRSNGKEADRGSNRPDEQEGLATNAVNQRHAEEGGNEVHSADGYRLPDARDMAKARRTEDAREIVENRIDSAQLIEGSDGNGEKNWFAIPKSPSRPLK
jgi:hypothetical protein